MDLVVLEGEHPAAGVLDDDDLFRAEEVLADHERADGVVGGKATGVPDDVRVAGPKTEHILDRQPGIHAGKDRQASARRQRKDGAVELGGVSSVLGQGSIELRRGVRVGHWGRVLRSDLPLPPGRRLAVLACMDARLTVEDVLGLRTGDAHIIRNAGGLATDDAIRSLVISQHLLGTEEVIVIEHTGCGMLTFEDEPVRSSIAEATGVDVDLPLQPFPDLEANLRAQVRRIRSHPWVKPVPVSGLVYDVETGRLRPIAA